MEYKIYVEKRENNPNFTEEIKTYRSNMYYNNQERPEEYITRRILEVVLTEEEFKRMKTAIIKDFE